MNRRQRRANSRLSRTTNGPRVGSKSATQFISAAAAEHLKVGIDHYLAGHLAEAEARFRQALAVQPDYADAQCNLGVVFFGQGKIDEAIAAYRQAIRIAPDFAMAQVNIGGALRKQGKIDEAIAAYRQAIRIMPDYAEAHCNLGIALQAQRKLEEAIAAYHQAIRIKPDYADAHCNLGIILYVQKKSNEAIASYRQAIRLKPDYAEAHYNLGIALNDQNNLDEAMVTYRQAIALKPDYAEAYIRLGGALLQAGQLSEAREAFDTATRLAPNNPMYRRGQSVVTNYAVGDPRLAELEHLARDSASLSDSDQIELHFALGKAYEDVGRHAEAFRQWQNGNALKRRQIAYNETATIAELDRIKATFTSDLFKNAHNVGNPSAVPIFILGMPRSGSTLIEQILASHPKVFGGGELTYFRQIVDGILTGSGSAKNPSEPASTKTGEDEFYDIGARYLTEIERLAPNAAHITDKMPRNFIFAGLIHLALPNAPIIHTVRDPVDTCLSCFSMLFTGEQNFTYDLAELGRYYRHYSAVMAHWHRVLPPGRILDVRYEDVVADLEGQARRIVAHCGLDWDPRCLAFHETERTVRTASAVQVRQPIYNSAVARWRDYAQFLDPLLAELGKSATENSLL